MSDSESEALGWRNTDQNRVSPSPVREQLKRQNSKELSNGPASKKLRKGDAVIEERPTSHSNNDDSLNYLTQPPMLLFKHFLNQQENNILVEDAMRKYSEYKEAFACQQLQSFFECHKDEEWFMEKYHPDYIEARENARFETVELRRRVFMELFEDNWMDNLLVHVSYQDSLGKLLDAGGNKKDLKSLEKKIVRSESPERVEIKMSERADTIGLSRHDFDNDSGNDSECELIEDKRQGGRTKNKEKEAVVAVVVDNPVSVKAEVPEEVEEGDMEHDNEDEPRPLHKTCSIFLRNIHASVFRSQIEEVVKSFPGYLRLALQDAMPERKFLRRGWLTFARNTDLKTVCWELSKVRLGDLDLGVVVNRELSQRVRPVSPLTNHRAVMRQDVKYAAKLVARFDRRRRCVWPDTNPLLRNITEHLVDEGSYEEEAYLGGDINLDLAITGGGDPANIKMEEDRELAGVMDRLVLYLRVVHSYDYYAATEYTIEDNLPSKCGLVHARGCLRHPDQRFQQWQIEEHMKTFGAQTELVLDSIDSLDFEVASRLGVKSVVDAVERFMHDNCKEISADKWLCPLSGKKFKGPEFVRKHIVNKYNDRIDNVRHTVHFFNNYILDPRRPQLPEHSSNRPTMAGAVLDKKTGGIIGGPGQRGDMGPGGGHARCNGDYYRKTGLNDGGNAGGGGGADNTRNGGGSYYSRKIVNYNDVGDSR